MSRVKVSKQRSLIGPFVTVAALIFLATLVFAGAEEAPPAPTPVAQVPTASPAPTQTIPPTPTPEPQPNGYVVTHHAASIVLYDPIQETVIFNFGPGEEFIVDEQYVVVLGRNNLRAYDLQQGERLWQLEQQGEYEVIARNQAFIYHEQLIVAEYIANSPLDIQLLITSYDLLSGAQQVQRFVPVDQVVAVVNGSPDGETVMWYADQTVTLYNMWTEESRTLTTDIDPASTIMAAEYAPSEHRWYFIDSQFNVYHFETEQPEIVHAGAINQKFNQQNQISAIDVLITTNHLYLTFIDQTDYRQIVVQYSFPDLVYQHDLTLRSSSGRMEHLSPLLSDSHLLASDLNQHGIWVTQDNTTLLFWDTQTGVSREFEMLHKQLVAVNPYQPPQTSTPLISSSNTEQTLPITQTLADSTPFVWYSFQNVLRSDSEQARLNIETLAPSGERTTVAEDIDLILYRPNNTPIFMRIGNAPELYVPEQGIWLPLAADYIQPETEWNEQISSDAYAFSPDGATLALINDLNDPIKIDQITTTKQLVYINMQTGAVEAVGLDSAFSRHYVLHGWYDSGIFITEQVDLESGVTKEGSSFWQINGNEAVEIMHTEYLIVDSDFDPVSQQLAYVEQFNNPNRYHLRIYDLKNQSDGLIYQAESLVWWVNFDQSSQTLYWIEVSYTESNPLDDVQVFATTPNQAEPELLYRGPLFLFGSFNQQGTDQASKLLWIRKNYYPTNLVEYAELDLQTRTMSHTLINGPFIYQGAEHQVIFQVVLAKETLIPVVLRIPNNTTQPDVVLHLSTEPEHSLQEIIYVP